MATDREQKRIAEIATALARANQGWFALSYILDYLRAKCGPKSEEVRDVEADEEIMDQLSARNPAHREAITIEPVVSLVVLCACVTFAHTATYCTN